MSTSKSIRELVPLDISGRHARKGFSYQDHVAVGLCISMLTNPALKEIWLETHEDILLFWENNGIITIEFVQVKAVNPNSRWSVPSICGNGNPNDSIVKKLMDQDRCTEAVLFRIISSYDVNSDLAVLKMTINSTERIAESSKENELYEEVKKKIGDLKTPNGKNIAECIKLCWWEKKADNIQDLINSNKIKLEIAFASLGKTLLWDQRDEIYQKMLKFCQDSSTGDLNLDSDCYKIKRDDFIGWLSRASDSLYMPSAAGAQKLEEKLAKAKNIRDDYIPVAKQLRWNYLQIRLTNDFIQTSDLTTLEIVVLGELYKMKIALDNDELDEDHFHTLCMNKLDEIKDSPAFINKNIPDSIFSGYMYKLTSDCLHRFIKVQA